MLAFVTQTPPAEPVAHRPEGSESERIAPAARRPAPTPAADRSREAGATTDTATRGAIPGIASENAPGAMPGIASGTPQGTVSERAIAVGDPGDGEGMGAAIRRVERSSGMLANKAVTRMNELLPWFPGMSARHRADIQLVVQAGISSFVEWCRRPEHARELSEDVFRVAPRELVRAVTFRRLVELVRVAVEAIETEVPTLAGAAHEQRLLADVLRYSRDIAFAGAVVYARAAEERGAWDARLEALVVDQIVRGEVDRALPSRAAALGWRNPPAVAVIVGSAPGQAPEVVVDDVHRLARAAGLEVLAGVHHDRLVVIVGGEFHPDGPASAEDRGGGGAAAAPNGRHDRRDRRAEAGANDHTRTTAAGPGEPVAPAAAGAAGAAVDTPLRACRALLPACGPGPVVVGPIAADLPGSVASARAALAASDVVAAWPAAPRPVTAQALLPERALAGDEEARRRLVEEVYVALRDAGAPLLATAGAYLDFGASLETTAKALYLHPNTVRYRLRKAADACGLDPADHRDRLTLHVALILGRLDGG
jgi:hypothetical protein